uniref:Uncharacterized protein n=1 Tax=Moniliophthora roreri TaxID=221103 RepID=A0A0W0FSH2_MONRR
MQAVMALLPARNPDRTRGLVGGQRIDFSTSSEVKHWRAGEIAQHQPYDLVRRSGHIGGVVLHLGLAGWVPKVHSHFLRTLGWPAYITNPTVAQPAPSICVQ